MFIFWKIKIGGVHLIEGFPNATRQRPEQSSFTTAARRQTAPPHHTHNFCWHSPRQRSHGEGNRYFYQLVVGKRVVLNFGDADTTQKATGATSAQIDFVCVKCTSNSSTAAVASLSFPLSLCVFVQEYFTQHPHFSTCPIIFSQLQRSACTNGLHSLLPQHR